MLLFEMATVLNAACQLQTVCHLAAGSQVQVTQVCNKAAYRSLCRQCSSCASLPGSRASTALRLRPHHSQQPTGSSGRGSAAAPCSFSNPNMHKQTRQI